MTFLGTGPYIPHRSHKLQQPLWYIKLCNLCCSSILNKSSQFMMNYEIKESQGSRGSLQRFLQRWSWCVCSGWDWSFLFWFPWARLMAGGGISRRSWVPSICQTYEMDLCYYFPSPRNVTTNTKGNISCYLMNWHPALCCAMEAVTGDYALYCSTC